MTPRPRGARVRPDRRIVLISSATVRDEWLARLGEAREEEKQWKEKLARFEAEARTGFFAWMQQNFSAMQADLLRQREEAMGLRVLMDETEALSARLRIPAWRAFAMVKGWETDRTGTLERLRNAEEAGSGGDGDEGGDAWNEFFDGDEDDDPEIAQFEFEEEFGRPDAAAMKRIKAGVIDAMMRMHRIPRKLAEAAFQEQQAEMERKRADWRAGRDRPKSPTLQASPAREEEPHQNRARSLFRVLARRLHPDAGAGAMDERSSALWHEVQSAYERQDLEALAALVWETEPDAAARDQAPVSVIARVLRTIQEQISTLRAHWDTLRSSPAYRFAHGNEKTRERLRREIERDMRADAEDIAYLLQSPRWQIKEWEERWQREVEHRERKAAVQEERTRKKREHAAQRFRGQVELLF